MQKLMYGISTFVTLLVAVPDRLPQGIREYINLNVALHISFLKGSCLCYFSFLRYLICNVKTQISPTHIILVTEK